jgi:endonuclease YncB( thermonuclease family)
MTTFGICRFVPILFLCLPAHADTPGPVPCDVVSVYDGDTFRAACHPWPGHTVRVSIRVNGIDTPEIRSKCPEEKDGAIAAREYAKQAMGKRVVIKNITHGKYAKRMLADVFVDGKPLAALLIENGHARPYSGGKRNGWCD